MLGYNNCKCACVPKEIPLVGRLRILRRYYKDFGVMIGGGGFTWKAYDTLQVKVGFNEDGSPMWNDVPIVEDSVSRAGQFYINKGNGHENG